MGTIAKLDEAMAEGAERAVAWAADQQLELDYSLDSVRIVERRLAALHEAVPRGLFGRLWTDGLSEADIQVAAMMFGAYVGEVLKKEFGGYWSDESLLDPGSKVLTLHFENGRGEVWPQIKVEKRLRNGPEDNVWHYTLSVAARIAGPGTARH